MVVRRLVAICGVSIGVAGCAIHPLPEDVTGDNTYEIVRKVRCEARSAVVAEAVELLTRRGATKETQEIGRAIQERRRKISDVKPAELDPRTREHVEEYDNTAIAYEFTFDITEKNNVGGSLDLLKTFTRGTLDLGLSAGADRSRQNKRNFIISDTFEDLIYKLPEEECADDPKRANWMYPITGSIGLAEVINTFINLNELNILRAKEAGKVPIFADTLAFETRLYASANPTLELSPVGNRFQITTAGLTSQADRKDLHQVIIALSLPPDSPSSVRVTKPTRTVREPVPVRRAARPVKKTQQTPAEQRAIGEIERQKTLQFFDSTRVLNRALGLPSF